MKKTNPILLLIIVFCSTFVVAQNNIMNTFNKMKDEKVLENASISFRVIDLDTDSAIAQHNSYNSLVPASTMKIVTTAAALVSLGSYTSFKTRLSYDGNIDSNGILHGNIYIKGGGDPTLGSAKFDEVLDFDKLIKDIVKKIKAENIGKLLVCEPNLKSHDEFELCSIEEAVKAADIILLLVDHKKFKGLKASELGEKVVIDTRGVIK